jgi:hypothetical protein
MKNKYYLTGSTVRKQKSSYPTIIRKPGKALITSSLPKYNVRYLKLRNLEFGYTFPKEWLQKCRINSLRLYLAGQNLFTLTNVPIDPEVSAGNGTAYPSMRIINLGLTLKF